MFPYPQDPLSGIIPRTLSNLFDELRIQQVEFTVRVSFLEIYNEELLDLLSATDDSSKLRYDDASEVIQYVCLIACYDQM
jgi:kinesin family protein 11